MGFQSFPDPVAYEVGKRTDAADAAGSLHAKVKDIRDNGLALLQKPRGSVGTFGSYSTSSSTYQTALNITGKGKLVAFKTKIYTPYASASMAIRITVDEIIVINCVTPQVSNGTYEHYPTGNTLFVTDGTTVGLSATAPPTGLSAGLEFKTSLKIEIRQVANVDTAYVYWYYEKE